MFDDSPYTGRGLLRRQDRTAYNAEATRIGWPMRVCDYCGCETRTQCPQADGGTYGWYANAGTVSCGACRCSEWVSAIDIARAKRGRTDKYFGPGEDIPD